MRIHYKTFGCKANQYDTERMRHRLEAAFGDAPPASLETADLCVLNTCTVTRRADASARRYVRRVRRRNPDAVVVVAGCSAALHGARYRDMDEVAGVVEGHDDAEVLAEALRAWTTRRGQRPEARRADAGCALPLVRSGVAAVGDPVLFRRRGAVRGWLKVQDGCDRKCSFCATRLARGPSRSRPPERIAREARILARRHPELVITGVHIGHYGRDLHPRTTLSALVRRLLDEVPAARFRLGSVEATEIDDAMIDLLAGSGGRLAPHLHMPMQSGSDPVLRRMRRWHTREDYRRRALEIAAATGAIGLGADVVVGFPGETDRDHERTVALVEELPFTYLHVFPYSPRSGTAAAALTGRVPERVAGERSRELRALAAVKGARHARARGGARVRIVMEGTGGTALTGDYMRVRVGGERRPDPIALHWGDLSADGSTVAVREKPAPARAVP